jgi:hypothetical protein
MKKSIAFKYVEYGSREGLINWVIKCINKKEIRLSLLEFKPLGNYW